MFNVFYTKNPDALVYFRLPEKPVKKTKKRKIRKIVRDFKFGYLDKETAHKLIKKVFEEKSIDDNDENQDNDDSLDLDSLDDDDDLNEIFTQGRNELDKSISHNSNENDKNTYEILEKSAMEVINEKPENLTQEQKTAIANLKKIVDSDEFKLPHEENNQEFWEKYATALNEAVTETEVPYSILEEEIPLLSREDFNE